MFSRSLSVSFSGESIAIFIKCDRLVSPIQFLSLVFIIFICEKLRSTEAVVTGMDKQTVERVLRLGNIATNISLLACQFLQLLFHILPWLV